MPKCQFSAAGDGVAAAAKERPYFILRKQLQKNARGRGNWLENRKDEQASERERERKKGREREAEKMGKKRRERKKSINGSQKEKN